MTLRVHEGDVPNGWAADVGNPPQLAEVVMSMQSHRSWAVHLMLEVASPDAVSADVEVLLPIRATSVRTVYPPGWDEPEYEFEGYVTRRADERETVWVRGALRTNAETSIKECTIYRTAPGQETGVERTDGIE